jgi:Family of unknown function (DUF6448)
MRALIMLFALAITAGSSRAALAHCDSLDGPVVTAAREALRTGDFTVIAIWVKSRQEHALQLAFRHAISVRKLGAEARELADTYFFETAVRLHREGEGEPSTGLVRAGARGAALTAAEHALVTGSSDEVVELVVTSVRNQLRERFHRVTERRTYRRGDVEAGRRYVATYADYIHYVIDLYTAAGAAPIRVQEPIRHED